jgi:hypothetical protein
MEKLFIVYEFETRKLKKGEFEEGKYFVIVDDRKVYHSQFDDLILFNNDVVVFTEDESEINYYKQEIRDFFDTYHKD